MLFEINETSHRSIMIAVDEREFMRIINATSTCIKVKCQKWQEKLFEEIVTTWNGIAIKRTVCYTSKKVTPTETLWNWMSLIHWINLLRLKKVERTFYIEFERFLFLFVLFLSTQQRVLCHSVSHLYFPRPFFKLVEESFQFSFKK